MMMMIFDKIYFYFLNYANIYGQEEIILKLLFYNLLLPKTTENFYDNAKVDISRNILQDVFVTCDVT